MASTKMLFILLSVLAFSFPPGIQSAVSNDFYRFGPCYGPVVENNKSFYTNVFAQVQLVNDTLVWYPEFNPQAVTQSDIKVSAIDVTCGPTGDFTYACNINKLSCSADLHTIYEMCNSNIFHSCKNNSLSSIAKYQTPHKNGNFDVHMFAAEGYRIESYASLIDKVRIEVSNKLGHRTLSVCMAHGAKGLSTLLAYVSGAKTTNANVCRHGIIALGSTPLKSHYSVLKGAGLGAGSRQILVLAGDLDGISRFSHFAISKHNHEKKIDGLHFGLIQGLSHQSFASFGSNTVANSLDLKAEIDEATGHIKIAEIVSDFLQQVWATTNVVENRHLEQSKALAAQVSGPLLKALKLEGSAKIGEDVCNSDYPTNPSCNYPKYPDFSLPPGPAPAPKPLPSSDCICGSDWVKDYAFPLVSGSADVGFAMAVEDAFHSVSDVHPFHLPHIWNKCTSVQGCTLNVTTLTENFPGSGQLFPNSTSNAPLSALELRAKMKSRHSLYKAVGMNPPSNVDKNYTLCRQANELAWNWALTNADASVRKRFEANGEPFVMVDDVEAPIGFHGPEWIEKTLVYKRVSNAKNGESHIEVQSWAFVVPDLPVHSKYLPTGMHYCKLLSPARAMEWIYLDSLRMKLSAHKTQKS